MKKIVGGAILLILFATALRSEFRDWIGPIFTENSYIFSGIADITKPDRYVCIEYNYDGVEEYSEICQDDGSENRYTCSMPRRDNSVVEYSINSYSDKNCKSIKTIGPTGMFRTSPTNAEIVDIKARIVSNGQVIMLIFGVVLGIILVVDCLYGRKEPCE